MFERFSSPARETMVRAQEEARSLGHNYIGTEHLLLAILQAGRDDVARDVLNEAGVSHDGVRRDVLAVVGEGEGAQPGHIPFTPRSKKVLELSLREALRLRDKLITPAHILLGIIREGEGMAAQLMTKQGVDLQQLRQEIVDTIAPEQEGRRGGRFGRTRRLRLPDRRTTPMTRGGATVADRALSLAAGGPVASQHYLLAVLDEHESVAAKALGALGVTREAVEATLAEIGTVGTSDESPEAAGARGTSLSIEDDTIQVRIEAPALTLRLTQLMEAQQAQILKGADLPGSERIWKALEPVLGDVVRELESKHGPSWTPPDWPEEVTVAAYAVSSQRDGPRSLFKVADGVDEQAVRAWLADLLGSQEFPEAHGDGTAFFEVVVGTVDVMLPGSPAGAAWTVDRYVVGAGPVHADWRRRPLSELVAFAIEDLRREAA
jgi:ATP-dependent Clp protease ATP-binding subunit ClpA